MRQFGEIAEGLRARTGYLGWTYRLHFNQREWESILVEAAEALDLASEFERDGEVVATSMQLLYMKHRAEGNAHADAITKMSKSTGIDEETILRVLARAKRDDVIFGKSKGKESK